MNLIQLKKIHKVYGKGEAKVEALKGIDLSIDKGEMIAIMGSSGSGKSTLLNILGCLDKGSDGEYYLKGEDISSFKHRKLAKLRNKTFGFIVQYFALLNELTVWENIKIPLEYSKTSKKESKERIIKILKMLGIEDKIKKHPNELSGGQNQRVAIARALANNPDIILADEPTGALDKKTGKEVMQIFKQLNEQGKTVIIVTHDENVAKECAKTIHIEDGVIVK